MKNLIKVIAFTAIVAFVMISCSKADDPKALAQETYNLSVEMMRAFNDGDDVGALEKQAVAIEERVAKLSAANALTYEAELVRLTIEGASDFFGDFFMESFQDTSSSNNSDDSFADFMKGLGSF